MSYRKATFQDIEDMINKTVTVFHDYIRVKSIKLFKGDNPINRDCLENHKKSLEEIKNYYKKIGVERFDEGERTAHTLIIVADAELAKEENGQIKYDFAKHVFEMYFDIVTGKEAKKNNYFVFKLKNPVFFQTPKVFEINAKWFNNKLAELKKSFGKVVNETDIDHNTYVEKLKQIEKGESNEIMAGFDCPEGEPLKLEIQHLRSDGKLRDRFATVNGFKPEDFDMLDFESVKVMIEDFDGYHETGCEVCK